MSKTIPQLTAATSLNLTDKIEVSQSDSPSAESKYGTLQQVINNIVNNNAQIASTSQVTGLDSALAQKMNVFNWNMVVADSQNLSASQGYIANNSGRVIFTLPEMCTFGKIIIVAGYGSGGWQINQGNLQTIHWISSTTTGTGGNLSSQESIASVYILCVVDNTDFLIINSTGNILTT